MPEGLEIPPEHKWCPDCGRVLPLSDFVRSVASTTGFSAYCKPCHNARSRASRKKVGGSRSYHLTRRYGITAAEADLLLREQNGVCAICRTAPAAHVDHDHETGAVRALLCFNCNGGLGQFKDDPVLLHTAAYYVTFHRTRQEVHGRRPPALAGPDAGSPPTAPTDGADRRPGGRRTGRGRRTAAAPEDQP